VHIEIRWCPAHEGVEGNEKADEWAKQAAEEPDARGVEWLRYGDRYGARRMPLPRSLANLRREIAEKKWAEARPAPARGSLRGSTNSGRSTGPPRNFWQRRYRTQTRDHLFKECPECWTSYPLRTWEGAGCRGGATAVPIHTPLHGICRRGVGFWGRFPWFFPLSSLVRVTFGTGLGGGQKGNLQRAATARTADGKNGQNVRRHSLDRLNASMI